MFLISIPKSASTSLSMALVKKHNLKYNNLPIEKTCMPLSKEKSFIEKRHGNMGDIRKEEANYFLEENCLYKRHLYPTKNNIELLKDQKKVILLRDPEGILHSWWRSRKNRTGSRVKEMNKYKNEKEYVKELKKNGTKKILDEFCKGWEKAAGKNDLIIYYEDLKNNPKETVNKVERHFGLSESKEVKLPKMRYNRGSLLRKFTKRSYSKLAKIKPLRKLKRKLFPNFTFG
jgi:hypothetical protein